MAPDAQASPYLEGAEQHRQHAEGWQSQRSHYHQQQRSIDQ